MDAAPPPSPATTEPAERARATTPERIEQVTITQAVRAAVDATDRSASDRALDPGRHPAETLSFLGITPSAKVAELGAGGGYTAELLARIVGCADTFDTCTSTRPYQKAMPLEKAMEILENLSGRQLDPAVVVALRRVLEKRGVRVEGHRLPVKLAS